MYCNFILTYVFMYFRFMWFVDDGHSFDQVIFYGNECTLVIFDLMMLSFFFVLTGNIVFAGICTGLLIKVCNYNDCPVIF